MASRKFLCYAVHVNAGDKGREILTPKKGANRSYMLIQNRSAGDIYINFDMVASILDGIIIVANGGFIEWDNVVPDGPIHITGSIATGGTDQRINITEAY